MDLIWLYIVGGVATVLVAGIFIWRFFDTASKGVTAVAGTASEAVDALRPVASGVGNAIDGAGSILHGAGRVVSSFADTLRNKQHERAQLAAENASLKAEIEQLKGRQINATAIERQLKVVLFSIATKHTSFKNQVEAINSEGGLLGLERPTNRQFLSIIDAKFTAEIGIDLKKLRFKLRPGSNVVHVFGAQEVETIGLRDMNIDELFSESRLISQKTSFRSGGVEILAIDDLHQQSLKKHRKEVDNEIQDAEWPWSIAKVNEEVALGFFRVLVGAGRYEFVAGSEPINSTLNFHELCEAINGSISERISKLEAAVALADARVEALDNDILETAIAGARIRD